MKRLLFILVPLLLFAACHTSRKVEAPIVLNNTDSVQIRTIVKTDYVPVKIEVPVPQQSVSDIVVADTSHIETDVAESNAWIRPDGSLFHNLINKDVKLTGETYVPQTSMEKHNEAIRTKEIPVPRPYEVYIEKQLSTAEQFKLSAFWYLVGFALVTSVYILRKPFLILMRKIV